jgi:homoserine kinase
MRRIESRDESRLHEQYRMTAAPLLELLQSGAPDGTAGVTLSGSGPTVVVWAAPESADDCAHELGDRFPDVSVLTLSVSPRGANVL